MSKKFLPHFYFGYGYKSQEDGALLDWAFEEIPTPSCNIPYMSLEEHAWILEDYVKEEDYDKLEKELALAKDTLKQIRRLGLLGWTDGPNARASILAARVLEKLK